MSTEEDTPLIAPQGLSLTTRKRHVHIYFVLLSAFFAIPQIAVQIVTYDLLFDVVCKSHGILPDTCLREPLVSETVANLLSAVSIMNGVVATVVTAVLSALSDRVGRKSGLLWFMLLSTAGIFAFPLTAYKVSPGITPWRMMIPYLFIALGGTPTIMMNLSVLHITDLLPDPHIRTQYLACFIGVVMLCQALAPAVGGAILSFFRLSIGSYLTFCAAWMALGTILAALAIRRSDPQLDHEEEHVSIRKQLTTFLRKSADTVTFKNAETPLQRRNALILLFNFFFANEFAIGFIDIIMIYAKYRFHWLAENIGQTLFYMFTIRTAWSLLGFPLLYGRLTKLWPAQSNNVDRADLVHMILSNVLSFLGFLVVSLATTSRQYTAGVLVVANDGIAGPVWINAILKHVSENKRGEFLAALGLVVKPAGTFLPAILMKIFQATINTMPNFVFIVVTGMAFLVTLSVFWIRPSRG